MRLLISVDRDLHLDESEGAQRFDNARVNSTPLVTIPKRKRIPFSPQNRFSSVAVETIAFRLESGSLP